MQISLKNTVHKTRLLTIKGFTVSMDFALKAITITYSKNFYFREISKKNFTDLNDCKRIY